MCVFLRVIGITVWLIINAGGGKALAADSSPSYFKYFPDGTPFDLGRGFIQNNLTKGFPQVCANFSPPPLPNGGADNIILTTTVTTTYNSLLSVIGIDLNTNVHYLTSSLDARFEENRRLATSASNVTIVIQASADYPNQSINIAGLVPPYNGWLNGAGGTVNDVIDQCGARVPFRKHTGVRLYAIVTIIDASTELQAKMSSSVDTSLGFGLISSSAKAVFDDELSSSKSSHHVSTTVFARGGTPSVLFEELVKAGIEDKTSIKDISAALGNFAGTLTQGNAAIIGFDVGDMPGISVAINDPWSIEKQSSLGAIVDLYKTLGDKRSILNGIVSGQDPRSVKYNQSQIQQFNGDNDTLTTAIQSLVTLHENCLSAKTPNLTPCNLDLSSYSAAIGIHEVSPLSTPKGAFVVAVRQGPDNQNSSLSPWVLLSSLDSASVFISPVANNSPAWSEFNDISQYETRLGARISHTIAGARRILLAYSVQSEDLDSVELYALSASNTFKAGFTDTKYTLHAWGRNDLRDIDLKANLGLGSGAVIAPILFEKDLSTLPQCNSCAPGSAEQTNWLSKYHDPVESYDYHIGKHLQTIVRHWIVDGQASTGSGEILLRVIDRFSGPTSPDLKILQFKWDYDDGSDFVQVKYNFMTAASPSPDGTYQNVMYMSNLKYDPPPTSSFPKIHRDLLWAADLPAPDYSGTLHYGPLMDKWNSITTKICKASVAPSSGFNEAMTIDPESTIISVSFVKDQNCTFCNLGPTHMGHTFKTSIDYIVKLSSDAVSNATFLADFQGCQ